MSSLDREAVDDIISGGGVSILSPLTTPNLWGWFAMVSKFSPEIRKNWPKMKAPVAPKDSEADNKKGGRGDGAKKGGRESKKAAVAKKEEEENFDDLFDADGGDSAAAESI